VKNYNIMKCEICSEDLQPFKKKNKFILYKCNSCGFMQYDYKLSSEIFKYITVKVWTKPSKSCSARGLQFAKYFINKNILDLGSGVARLQQGFDKVGVRYRSFTNIDTRQISNFSHLNNINVIEGDISTKSFLEKIKNQNFDTIISSHSLEHLPYPDKVLDIWKTLLNDNSHIYIEVPLYDNVDMEQDFWLVYEHISYFNKKSFLMLMNKHFECVETDDLKSNNVYFIGRRKM
jgi:SAM-dependent methyltransferase